jgi:hypothetical protein
VNEENYGKLRAWLALDDISFITHRIRIEDGIRKLGPIYGILEKHKSTI